jgi:DNA-binding transcriptional LysR family regulator
MAPDSLAGVAAFVAVVEAGSFTIAAERLGVTKSAVGKSVNRLEARLGAKLIHRTTRRLRLTFDGQTFYKACTAALGEIATAEALITPQDNVLRGRVHVDMPMAFGRKVLLPLLLEIAAPHPELALTMSFNDATVDPMLDQADLVIRFGQLQDSSHLVARRLARQRRIVCGAPAYLERHGTPATPADLNRHRCIVGTVDGPPQRWTLTEDGRTVPVVPPTTHRLSDGESIVETAVAGFGLCQMPSALVRQRIEQGRLIPVLEAYSDDWVDIHLLWLQEAALAPRVRYVIDALIEHAKRGALD